MKTYVVGDIHGGYKGFKQVLQRAGFDYENDKLICLGDVCDGWPEVAECFEELLKIKNLVYVIGNHDEWAMNWMAGRWNIHERKFSGGVDSWKMHGGMATYHSYVPNNYEYILKHLKWLEEQPDYYLDESNRLFVHGGINPLLSLDLTDSDTFHWDRVFWRGMYEGKNWGTDYNEIYVGHTPTIHYPSNKEDCTKPLRRNNVWNMDTGACFTGKISMMNVDTKELFQSDEVWSLYPDHEGRNIKTYNHVDK